MPDEGEILIIQNNYPIFTFKFSSMGTLFFSNPDKITVNGRIPEANDFFIYRLANIHNQYFYKTTKEKLANWLIVIEEYTADNRKLIDAIPEHADVWVIRRMR